MKEFLNHFEVVINVASNSLTGKEIFRNWTNGIPSPSY